MLDTVRCSLCNNWMANVQSLNNQPRLYCGVCKYGFMLMSVEAIENLGKACERINESDLPPRTLSWYKKRVESAEKTDTGKEEAAA